MRVCYTKSYVLLDRLYSLDLMAVDYVPELIDAGVTSFKIEGRLKGPGE